LLTALKETPTDLEQPQWYYGFKSRCSGSGFFVRLDIIEALVALEAHDAVPALIACFKEPPIEGSNMRPWIADALAQLVSKDTAAQLKDLMNDPSVDEESRKKFSAALEKVQ
jgi:HEAT repeat protein